jgi:hypothetical protein
MPLAGTRSEAAPFPRHVTEPRAQPRVVCALVVPPLAALGPGALGGELRVQLPRAHALVHALEQRCALGNRSAQPDGAELITLDPGPLTQRCFTVIPQGDTLPLAWQGASAPAPARVRHCAWTWRRLNASGCPCP